MKRKAEAEELDDLGRGKKIVRQKHEFNGGEKGQKMWWSHHGMYWLRGELIGKGSFGSVFLATPRNLSGVISMYQVKLPPVMAVKSAEYPNSESIRRESQILIEIKGSPFVIERINEEVTYSEDGEHDVKVYNLLLEYASGGSLGDLLKKSNGHGLPESDVKEYTKSILQGLEHIHNCEFVHCDLKSENILLVPRPTNNTMSTNNFVAKIADFGLSKRCDDNLGYWRGTPAYLSPEALNKIEQEPPSDIWSLGCIVLEMLTGNPIHNFKRGYEFDQPFNDIVSFDHAWIPQIPADITGVARDFLNSCLACSPWERLTAEKLLLHPFLAKAKPPSPPIWAKNRKVARRTKVGLILSPTGFEIPAGL